MMEFYDVTNELLNMSPLKANFFVRWTDDENITIDW